MKPIDIKHNRKRLGLTQDELAKLVGVSKRTIINYEKGEVIPTTKNEILHNILLRKSGIEKSLSEKKHNTITYGNDTTIEQLQKSIFYLNQNLESLEKENDIVKLFLSRIRSEARTKRNYEIIEMLKKETEIDIEKIKKILTQTTSY